MRECENCDERRREHKSVFERLTDVRLYTGTSRFRFDELGNGRGKAGREDMFLRTGWAPAASRPHEVYASVLRLPRSPVIEPGTLGVQKFGTQAITLKMVWLYRNGDACHKGENFFVKAAYKDLVQLLKGITNQLRPIAGPARRIYDQNLVLLTELPELVDGAKYLVTSGEPPAPLDRLENFLSPFIDL